MPESPHTRDMRTPHTRQTTHVAPQSKPQAVGLQALSRWEHRPPQTRHQDKLQIHIQGHHDTRTNSRRHTQGHHDTTHRHHTGSCRQQDSRHCPVGSIRPPHTMEPRRSNIRHQDTTVTIHQDVTKQASHSKAQAVGPQALFSCDQQTGI